MLLLLLLFLSGWLGTSSLGYFSHLNPSEASKKGGGWCSVVRWGGEDGVGVWLGAQRVSQPSAVRIRMQRGSASSRCNMTSRPQGYAPARADRQIYDAPLISAFNFMVPNFRFRLRCSLNQFPYSSQPPSVYQPQTALSSSARLPACLHCIVPRRKSPWLAQSQ